MNLSDAAIAAEVEATFRVLAEGRASLASAGEALLRRLLGLEREASQTGPRLNLPATDTGD